MKTLLMDGEESFNHDFIPYKKLWFAVLNQAIGDALNDTSTPIMKRYAVDFFLDKKNSVGTFCWICDFLDLNPEYILKNVRRLYMKNLENKERIERTIIKNKKKRDMIDQGLAKLVIDEKDKIKFVFTERYNRIQNKLERENGLCRGDSKSEERIETLGTSRNE
jgi:hypothetical protein